MEIDHPIQRKILLKLIHAPEMTFSELLEGDSNKFAYHLGVLEAKNIISKKDGLYSLSSSGKKLSSFIEGDTGRKAAFPTFANVLIIEKDGKYLVQRRLKEPFYGYWGLVSGKVNFGYNIEECALRDIEEETGLVAGHARFIGINQAKTYEDGKLLHHHIMFYVRMGDVSGVLKNTHKGENRWMTLDEFLKKEMFPAPWLFDVLSTDKFITFETERMMKDGKFSDCRMKNMKKIM